MKFEQITKLVNNTEFAILNFENSNLKSSALQILEKLKFNAIPLNGSGYTCESETYLLNNAILILDADHDCTTFNYIVDSTIEIYKPLNFIRGKIKRHKIVFDNKIETFDIFF